MWHRKGSPNVRNDITGTTDGDGNTTELSAAELAEKEITMNEILNEAKESGDLSAAAEAHDLTATTVHFMARTIILPLTKT